MKKLLTSTLAFVLVASMGVTAFAADNTATNNGTAGTDITVNGKYQAGAPAADVIFVDIAWDAMDFTYTAPSKGTWNTATHQYENAVAGGWAATSGTDPKITLTNHSNIPVKVNFAFATDVSGLDGLFSDRELFLDTAENTTAGNAPSAQSTFSLAGDGIDATQDVGTVTVTVANAVTTVSTAEELLATADKSGFFKLANDIDLGISSLDITSDRYILDLNGHTLSGNTGLISSYGSAVTIKNGVINDNSYIAIKNEEGKLTLDNCTVASAGNAAFCNYATAIANSCKFSCKGGYKCVFSSGNITFSGNIKLENGRLSNEMRGTVTALPGTYNFDVSSYVDTGVYDVTNDGTTWTVTEK